MGTLHVRQVTETLAFATLPEWHRPRVRLCALPDHVSEEAAGARVAGNVRTEAGGWLLREPVPNADDKNSVVDVNFQVR